MRMRRRILPVAAFLALLPSFCYADDEFVKVMGFAECVDCSKSGIKTSQAFSGLQVTVECRAADGHVETSQAAELSEDEGKFTVSLPQKLAMEAKLGAQTCSAKLLAADLSPCKPHHAAEDAKLLVSPDHLQLMTISGKLKLSTQTCVSKFFWTHPFHPITFPPCQPLFQPPPPPPPAVKSPPPPVPVYKAPPPPPVPVYRPTLRTVMIYKPPPSPKFKKLSRPTQINLHPNSPIHSPALAKLPPIPEEDPRRYFHHRKYGKTIS